LSAAAHVVEYPIPHKFAPFLKPKRFKIAKGGRDSAKSWTIAQLLLLEGASRPIRVGCFREVQKSLKDSVYTLLKDQIDRLELADFYTATREEIRGANGTLFVFSGLSLQTKDSLKSFEGLDYAWVEEAHSVSQGSWDVLTPTIRKPGSEIWVSFNPEMDTDPVYRMFCVNERDDAVVVSINWYDNPWKSDALDSEREAMKRDDPEKYAHIYEGQCRPAVEGAIYYKEVSKLRSSGRFHPVPYDPMLKVHVVCDLGFNDYMSLLLVQRLASEIRVIRYIEDRKRDIPSYSTELKDLKLNYGTVWLPHDAKATTLTAASNPIGVTAQEQFRNLGWTTQIVPNINVEQGIRKAREVFPRVHIDSIEASELLNRLGRYRRHIKPDGQATIPVHDDESHGSDGFRYLALIADQMTNDMDEGWGKKLNYDSRGYV
jgi:phage terminase large subunit